MLQRTVHLAAGRKHEGISWVPWRKRAFSANEPKDAQSAGWNTASVLPARPSSQDGSDKRWVAGSGSRRHVLKTKAHAWWASRIWTFQTAVEHHLQGKKKQGGLRAQRKPTRRKKSAKDVSSFTEPAQKMIAFTTGSTHNHSQ